ncbi:class E sortase [Streptomyces sp. NPDC051211]|uniref:class E sortase n=1 Tax=Streptomyces sp. NPDC051211 TaxID=3154643 RepID=UPI00344F4E67
MRDRIPVVVQGRRRGLLARGLWGAAELAVTAGVVVMLLVVHQVWWTNRQAVADAREQVAVLEEAWGRGDGAELPAPPDPEAVPRPYPSETPSDPSSSGAPLPDGPPVAAPSRTSVPAEGPAAREQAYAVLRIPRLGVAVPVAQGVSRRGVLDKGYVGHYPGTGRPGAQGNFALAGHRNTHGEPFRYINRLRVGDELVVDVKGKRFVYVVGKTLGETSERDTGVIAAVPRSTVRPQYGYSEPGAYITLTTCTPEYSSKYRLVVWGTLKSSERRTPAVSGRG